jgi:hypothetical protein
LIRDGLVNAALPDAPKSSPPCGVSKEEPVGERINAREGAQ